MAKVLDVYYEGSCQRLKFYPATPKDEVLELVLKMFNMFPTDKAKLEEIKHQSIFLDEDGDPVVFVPDVLPSGTKLTLRLQPVWQGTFTASELVQPPSKITWHWDPDVNAKYCKFKLTENNTCAATSSMSEVSMPVLCGSVSFTSGRHKWRCCLSRDITYCGFGLISSEEKQLISVKQFGDDFTAYPLFDKFFRKSGLECIFDLDMDTRICTVRTRGRDASEMKVVDLPNEVWPAVTMKNPHCCEARIFFDV